MWRRKVLFRIMPCIPSSREIRAQTHGGNLETKTDADTIEIHGLLTCLLGSIQPVFLYTQRTIAQE